MVTLTDIYGESFTEGDRVVYASSNGLRIGKVDFIKESTSRYGVSHRVYLDLSEHRVFDEPEKGSKVVKSARMYKKRHGYDYDESYFMKLG